MWPDHWSLTNALRMKVSFRVAKIVPEGEVVFRPEPLSLLYNDKAGSCWENSMLLSPPSAAFLTSLLLRAGSKGKHFLEVSSSLPGHCCQVLVCALTVLCMSPPTFPPNTHTITECFRDPGFSPPPLQSIFLHFLPVSLKKSIKEPSVWGDILVTLSSFRKG